MTGITRRVSALERQAGGVPEDRCPRPAYGLLIDADNPYFDEADAQPCRGCGGRHILAIREEVVGAEGRP
jgi:hypothetical protein